MLIFDQPPSDLSHIIVIVTSLFTNHSHGFPIVLLVTMLENLERSRNTICRGIEYSNIVYSREYV